MINYKEFLKLTDEELKKYIGKTLVFYHQGNPDKKDPETGIGIIDLTKYSYNYNIQKIYNDNQDMGIAIFASCIEYEPDYVEVFSKSEDNFACWKAQWESIWDTVEVLENSEARKILENIFMKWLDSELK